jgi:hypothetical protein
MKKQENTEDSIYEMRMIYRPYTVNSECRETVTKTIAICSFGCSLLWALCDLERWLMRRMGMANLPAAVIISFQILEAILPLTLYGVLTYLYNNYIWKWGIIYRWHKLPDLSGMWEGWLSSPLKDERRKLVIQINQRWNKIAISTKTNTGAEASAFTAAAIKEEDGEIKLNYSYNNHRQDEYGKNMSYQGFNTLTLKQKEGKWVLGGEYFTNKCFTESPGYGSKGSLIVTRKEMVWMNKP